jgi:hypothetical protein
MSNSLNRTLERVRQNRAQLAREDDAATRRRISRAPGARTMPLVAGDVAFDLVSGEHVEVVGVEPENVVVPTPERRDG